MSFSQEEVNEAAKTALGRKKGADAALYEAYKDFDGSLDDLKRAFAGTVEARKNGVDTEQYGIKAVDYSALSEDDKRYTDAFQRVHGKKVQMTVDELDNWRRNGSPELLEAEGKGLVKTGLKDGKRTLQVSKEAYKKFGSALFTGLHSNEAILIEKGSGYAGDEGNRIKAYSGDGVDASVSEKYDVYTKEAKEHRGLLGEAGKAIGLSKGAQKSLDRIGGQVGATIPGLGDEFAAIAGGTTGVKARADLFDQIGINPELLGTIDKFGNVITSGAASIADALLVGGLPVFSTASSLASTAAMESQGVHTDWESAGRGVAASWVTAGVGRAIPAAASWATETGKTGLAGGLNVANTAFKYGGADALSQVIQGGNSEDLLMAAGRGFLMRALPQDATTQGIASFGLGYADAKRKGLDDESAFTNATLAATVSATLSMRNPTQNPLTSWGNRWGELKNEFSNLGAAPAPPAAAPAARSAVLPAATATGAPAAGETPASPGTGFTLIPGTQRSYQNTGYAARPATPPVAAPPAGWRYVPGSQRALERAL